MSLPSGSEYVSFSLATDVLHVLTGQTQVGLLVSLGRLVPDRLHKNLSLPIRQSISNADAQLPPDSDPGSSQLSCPSIISPSTVSDHRFWDRRQDIHIEVKGRVRTVKVGEIILQIPSVYAASHPCFLRAAEQEAVAYGRTPWRQRIIKASRGLRSSTSDHGLYVHLDLVPSSGLKLVSRRTCDEGVLQEPFPSMFIRGSLLSFATDRRTLSPSWDCKE